ncbi:hypothetical protein BPAE_0005g00160 [Botrytis paeoniae]|uniref:Uncharacterized protein n=1 Tax=Botrytis paeoniae TaxID=278948 RepID=A0A4Z1G861_9HELO|nr:hypothetical protein BPAE_0005g00160 [Botrytis paeoniae]
MTFFLPSKQVKLLALASPGPRYSLTESLMRGTGIAVGNVEANQITRFSRGQPDAQILDLLKLSEILSFGI